jgi:membrane-bound lytic murein transglycosylase A
MSYASSDRTANGGPGRIIRGGALARRIAIAATISATLALAGCQSLPPCASAPTDGSDRVGRYEAAPLPVLADAELLAAVPAWRQSCTAWQRRQKSETWAPLCNRLDEVDVSSAAALRELLAGCCDAWHVVAVEAPVSAGPTPACRRLSVDPQTTGLMTGYFEPELDGSRNRNATYRVPLYGVPPDLVAVDLAAVVPELQGRRVRGRLVTAGGALRVVPYWSRAEIDRGEGPGGDALFWVDDELAAFLLEVQGSGRVRLEDGSRVRVGYADTNGQPYRSIGRWLVDQGELTREQATTPAIAAWAHAHPDRLQEMLETNPSYVFFRELPLGDPALGPSGAFGVPLTADHSLAIDPRFLPLGAPIVTAAAASDARFAFGQDTGGAIRGPLRFDLFRGTGPAAGAAAGEERDRVEAWLLLPKGVEPQKMLPPPAPPR